MTESASDDVSQISTTRPSKKRKLSVKSIEEEKKNIHVDADVEWKEIEMELLVESVLKEVGDDLMDRNHSSAFKQIDWEKVEVPGFSAEQCKKRWSKLEKKVRKFRTAGEIINDARTVIKDFNAKFLEESNNHSRKKIKLEEDPDKPKRPTPPVFIYLNKHRESFKQEHPELSKYELNKGLCDQYNQLSTKKKLKYQKRYQADMDKWKIELEEYLERHPEKRQELVKKPKLLTPAQLYVNDMLQKHGVDGKGDSEEGRRMAEKYKAKWNAGTSESRKVKYIRQAVELYKTYQEDMERYCQKHKFAIPTRKSVLTKAEQKLKDKFDGKPDNPPMSGYTMFSKHISSQLSDVAPSSRLTEYSKRWQLLSEEEREEWKQLWLRQQKEYLERLDAYVQGLPEEERVQYASVLNKMKKKKKAAKVKSIKEEQAPHVDTDADSDNTGSV